MHEVTELNMAGSAEDKADDYRLLAAQATALFEGESDIIANAANLSALLYASLPGLNWAGFYRLKDGELVLGPFQGKPACVRIGMGTGVCGAAAAGRKTVVVPDVHAFPGHIACDAVSRSEIVVPVIFGGNLLGVLDLDSPLPERFDETDRDGLEAIVAAFVQSLLVSGHGGVDF